MRPAPLPALLSLALAVPAWAAPVVEAEPSRLVLGPRARAEITVRNAAPGLHAAVSMGTLTTEGSGEGLTRFLWTPPADARAPTLVLFAFWSGDAPALSVIRAYKRQAPSVITVLIRIRFQPRPRRIPTAS